MQVQTRKHIYTPEEYLELEQTSDIRHEYFAGEVLNIDGLTGGFNFQSAWTGAYMISKEISSKL